tara:strand:+ start:1438 stop:1692 length:255 start_codon:yes stop_codon:yes gene_type:complete
MQEKDLLSFGFKKTDVTDSESQNGYDYYYYSLQLLGDIRLVSLDNDEVGADGEWCVKFEEEDIEIWSPLILGDLLEVFNRIKEG